MAVQLAHGRPGDTAEQMREVEAFNNYFDGISDPMAPAIASQGIQVNLSLDGFSRLDAGQPDISDMLTPLRQAQQATFSPPPVEFANLMAGYWNQTPETPQRAPAGSALDVGQSLLGAFGAPATKAPAMEEGITGIGGLGAAFNAMKEPEPQGTSRVARYRNELRNT